MSKAGIASSLQDQAGPRNPEVWQLAVADRNRTSSGFVPELSQSTGSFLGLLSLWHRLCLQVEVKLLVVRDGRKVRSHLTSALPEESTGFSRTVVFNLPFIQFLMVW